MKKNLLILLNLIVINTTSCGNLKDACTDNNKQESTSEFAKNNKKHKTLQSDISQNPAHEKDEDIDTQIKNLRTQNIQLSAVFGAMIGASIAVGITAICFPPGVPFVTAKAGATIAAATTTVSFSTVLPGAIATGTTLGAASGLAVNYRN